MGKEYKFNEQQIEKIINDYTKELKSVKLIAKEYNMDVSVIKRVLKNNDIKIVNVSAYSIKYWIERGLSEEQAINKIKTFKPIYIDYWLNKGYDRDEAKFKIECHLMNTERAFISKYGEIEGKLKYKEKKDKEGKASPRKKQYWLDKGYSDDEAKTKISEIQKTFTLEKCIEKYGEEDGKKRFTERQNIWQKSLTNNGNIKMGYSKISQELFYKLLETYDINYRDKINFATHNGEFRLNNPNGGVYIYDFIDIDNRKIIEYNGDMYHANPKKYKENDTPHPYRKDKTAKEIWALDKIKIKTAEDNGYEVLIIWDSEYRWGNKKNVVTKSLNFLNIKK
jgi:hypothetical protein